MFAARLLLICWLHAFPAEATVPHSDGDVVTSDSSGQQSGEAREVIAAVEQGLQSGEAGMFASFLHRHVYVSLRGSENGYFSANQAILILRNYLSTNHLSNVKFSTVQTDGEPFATGSGTIVQRANRETVQVYIALVRTRDRWAISQFNVY